MSMTLFRATKLPTQLQGDWDRQSARLPLALIVESRRYEGSRGKLCDEIQKRRAVVSSDLRLEV